MKVFDILQESKVDLIEQHLRSSDLLLESVCQDLDKKQKQIVEGIYNELRPLIEASLTADQINKIFTDVEAGATAGGGNRTLLGKGKDTVAKANEIINKAGKWLQDTKPVKAFDQKFDDLKRKINTTFPDSKILDGISKLGILAKENPGKTAAVVGILTAIASLAGGPLGGAIAGQVLRGSVELLKGEKLSTAIGKGVKTAALGYLSGKAFEMLGDWVAGFREKVIPFGPKEAGLEEISWSAERIRSAPGLEWKQTSTGFNALVRPEEAEAIRNAISDIQKGNAGAFDSLLIVAREVNSKDYKAGLDTIVQGAWKAAKENDSLLQWINGLKTAASAASQGAVAAAGTAADGKKESIEFTNNQIKTIFEWCNGSNSVINEGPMDVIKGLAGKAAGKIQQVGKNLTTKVTADKLQKAWKAAGSPTDSDQVADILRNAGVSDEVLSPVYKSMKVKLNPPGTAKPQQQSSDAKTQNDKQQSTTNIDLKSILTAVNTMRSRDLQSLGKYADQLLGKSTAAKPSAPSAKGAEKSKYGEFGFNQDTGEPFKSQAERDAFYKQDGSIDPRKRQAAPATQPNTVKVGNKTRGKPAAKPAVAV